MLSGRGSLRSGGRFNATGTFPAIYGSSTPELARIESLAYRRRANLPVEWALPLVIKAIHVEIQCALDLTDSIILAGFQLSRTQLLADRWWIARAQRTESFTQALGRAAYSAGVQGLIVPSAQGEGSGHNVVIFPDRIQAASCLRIIRGKPR